MSDFSSKTNYVRAKLQTNLTKLNFIFKFAWKILKFNFISIIRLPDFVTKEDFDWAIGEATNKKKQDFSKVEFLSYNEGICVQCMHIGSYDNEPETINLMHEYMIENGYELDITGSRFHHEIYLSDPRRCDVSKLKTVIRHPIIKSK